MSESKAMDAPTEEYPAETQPNKEVMKAIETRRRQLEIEQRKERRASARIAARKRDVIRNPIMNTHRLHREETLMNSQHEFPTRRVATRLGPREAEPDWHHNSGHQRKVKKN
jgi:hypothetical protein